MKIKSLHICINITSSIYRHHSNYLFRISGGKFRDKKAQDLIPVRSPINILVKRGGCGCRWEMLTATFHCNPPLSVIHLPFSVLEAVLL